MKRSLVLIFILALILSVTTGILYFRGQNIRKTAWKQMSPETKVLLKGTWKDGKVTKIILNRSMGTISDKSYIGKKVYLVEFPMDTVAMPSSIGVFVSLKDYEFIGTALND